MNETFHSRFGARAGRGGPPSQARRVHLKRGMVLEDPATGYVGAVLRVEKSGGMHVVDLEDRFGRVRTFPLGPGFWLEGEPIVALPPRAEPTQAPARTNSGSRATPDSRARVAKASRIWVEGRHDGELIQHVWGEDLAFAGVAVELLEGADNLLETLEGFGPSDTCRAGVLLDHMVPNSKESRLAAAAQRRWGGGVMILGHPYVDVWQAIKPHRVGLERWPTVPRDTDIKVGSLRALGLPHSNQADVALGWKRILRQVRDYRDLEPGLLGPVEQLIDFVTAPGSH